MSTFSKLCNEKWGKELSTVDWRGQALSYGSLDNNDALGSRDCPPSLAWEKRYSELSELWWIEKYDMMPRSKYALAQDFEDYAEKDIDKIVT